MWELALRLGGATIIGGLIGLNRELRDKPAGLRTHALVALGSALLMLVTVSLTVSDGRADPDAVSRTLQGIVTGIGFLGGGVILRNAEREVVRGLTTAASIWVTAALGIVCAVGLWRLVIVATLLAIVVLTFGVALENFVHRVGGKQQPSEGNERDSR
jgi:putative Mg2+ transporter-C (MgtC) family protein